jgi:glutamate/aspartate transport system permease protein
MACHGIALLDLFIFKSYPLLLQGALTTVTIALTAIVFGLILSVFLVTALLSKLPVLSQVARLYIDTFRTLPLVMVLLGFYLVVPDLLRLVFQRSGDIRLLAAIIAFTLFEAAYFAEILRSGMNAVPKNQTQGAIALGFTRGQTFRFILLPQAFKNCFPALLTQCIILFQDVSLVYVIGLPDFFGMAVKIGARDGEIVSAILFASGVYLILCILLQRGVDYLKKWR